LSQTRENDFSGFMNRFMNCFDRMWHETLFAAACTGNGNFNDRIYSIVFIAELKFRRGECAASSGMRA